MFYEPSSPNSNYVVWTGGLGGFDGGGGGGFILLIFDTGGKKLLVLVGAI